jgi:DNA-binding YbaB/EbfC family protein
LNNDALRHEMTDVLALVREQMAEIAAMQKKQAELTATGEAADGMVEVTVNAQGQLLKTVIDESYLEEYEFEQLADHVTEAAQAAVRDVTHSMSEMMVPIGERRKRFPSLSEFIEGAPDLRELVPDWSQPVASTSLRNQHGDDDGIQDSAFPTVRR